MPLVDHCPLFSALFVGHLVLKRKWSKGPFNNYVDKIKREGIRKCFFLSMQGIKTVSAGGGGGSKNGKILST